MKNLTKLLLIPVAIISFIACNKKKDEDAKPAVTSTTKALLTGKWLVTATGSDDNKNGKLDSIELVLSPTTETIVTVFNQDGSGYNRQSYNIDTSQHFDDAFIWSLKNNDQDIYTISSDNTSSLAHIEKITSTDLTTNGIEDVDSVKIWFFFKKQ